MVGACVAWGLDNNFTRKISATDPVIIAMLKGLVAGAVNLGLGFFAGATLPDLPIVLSAGALGLFGIGISLVMFIFALRHLGTARTGAYYSLAPFIGAVLAIAVLDEPLTPKLMVAGCLWGLGYGCTCRSAMSTSTNTKYSSTNTLIPTTSTTSTHMTVRRLSRILTATVTSECSTSTRTIPTCIIDTNTERDSTIVKRIVRVTRRSEPQSTREKHCIVYKFCELLGGRAPKATQRSVAAVVTVDISRRGLLPNRMRNSSYARQHAKPEWCGLL